MHRTHLHYLLSDGLQAFDVSACVLALSSRGRLVLAGEKCFEERAAVAAVLAGGALAELLASGRPIRADSTVGAYVFEELDLTGGTT